MRRNVTLTCHSLLVSSYGPGELSYTLREPSAGLLDASGPILSLLQKIHYLGRISRIKKKRVYIMSEAQVSLTYAAQKSAKTPPAGDFGAFRCPVCGRIDTPDIIDAAGAQRRYNERI